MYSVNWLFDDAIWFEGKRTLKMISSDVFSYSYRIASEQLQQFPQLQATVVNKNSTKTEWMNRMERDDNIAL